MAAKPNDLATYAILQSYVKMIATKCSQTYSKKVDTIKKIECGNAVPTGSSSTTKVMCLICTYDDGTVINMDATPITSAMSDVVSKSDLADALKDYVKSTDFTSELAKYTNTTDLNKDFLKIADAYNPTNKDTLNLFTQDASGKLLFNGKEIESSSGTVEWNDVANKPFSAVDNVTITVADGKLKTALDTALSDTSENGVQNKAIAVALKDYQKITDAYNPSNKDTLGLFTQDTSGNLLFDGKGIISSSGGSTTEWSDVANKPFSTLDSTSFSVEGGMLKATGNIVLDDALSDTSENSVKNKVITNELKNYTKNTDLTTKLSDYVKNTTLDTKLSDYTKTTVLESNYVKTTALDTKLSDYTKTTVLESNYAKKSELHEHTNKTVLDSLSDDGGNLKYGTNILLTQAIIDGLISEKDADKKYIALANIETDTLDLTTL